MSTTFVYKAKKSSAETVTGVITARNQDEAVDLINQLGFLPVSIEPKSETDSSAVDGTPSSLRSPKKISSKELYFFSCQLANLLKSGVSILKALIILAEQTQNKYFRRVLAQIGLDIKNGRSLSEALSSYPQIFSPLYITMVGAGEESGHLQQMLINVAEYQRKQNDLVAKVRTALVYPCLMMVVGIGTVYFILTFVLPKMAALFDTIGDALPMPTAILLKTSKFFNHSSLWIVLTAAFISLILFRLAQSNKGRIVKGRVLLHTPIFGSLLLKADLARFSRTLSLLLKSGVPITRALYVAIPILSNEIIKKYFSQCREELIAGGSFGLGLQQFKEIPSMMGHLMAVGEESGNLPDVLAEIAQTYEQETDELIKIMTTLLEPIMILLIGAVVGFIVFAMLLPIFQMDILSK